MLNQLPKLITILGPTASGKSSLGIELAQKFNGEIVSADSRQVYRGLNIGSGKVTKEEQKMIPHHLLDIVDPMDDFSVAHFQKRAFKAIDHIIAQGKLPFLVGGTALYIYSVINNYKFSDVPPNPERRKELESKTIDELLVIASEGTPERGNPVTNAHSDDDGIAAQGVASLWLASVASLLRNDMKNPRRLIRAIEKLEAGESITQQKNPSKYENIIFGMDFPRDVLYQRIDQRVDERLKQGMIEEVKNLLDKWPQATRSIGEGWLISLGLEYRFITEYLCGKCQPKDGQPLAETRDEMVARLKHAIHAFARRQMTWFKRDKRIIWIKNAKEAEKIVSQKEKGLA